MSSDIPVVEEINESISEDSSGFLWFCALIGVVILLWFQGNFQQFILIRDDYLKAKVDHVILIFFL